MLSFPNGVIVLPELQTLDLNTNKIRSIPPEVSTMSQLSSLDVSSNDIQAFPREIGRMDHLQLLRVEGNLTKIPRSTVIKGTASILECIKTH